MMKDEEIEIFFGSEMHEHLRAMVDAFVDDPWSSQGFANEVGEEARDWLSDFMKRARALGLTKNALAEMPSEPLRNLTFDPVARPAHYNSHPSGVECRTITRWMNFNLGNVFKYIWRAGSKGPELEDLRKAHNYLEDEIRRISGELESKSPDETAFPFPAPKHKETS
jgi:hypothetical protein